MERLTEERLFTATDRAGESVAIGAADVETAVESIAKKTDLSRFILGEVGARADIVCARSVKFSHSTPAHGTRAQNIDMTLPLLPDSPSPRGSARRLKFFSSRPIARRWQLRMSVSASSTPRAA